MKKKKNLLFLMMMLLFLLVLSGCNQQQDFYPKNEVKVDFIEEVGEDYKNAVQVTSVGEYPVVVNVKVEAKDNNEEISYYNESVELEVGESKIITINNHKILSVVYYDVILLPKICDLSTYAIVLGVVAIIGALVICIVAVINGSDGGPAAAIAIGVLFGVVMILFLTSVVIELIEPGSVVFEVFGILKW